MLVLNLIESLTGRKVRLGRALTVIALVFFAALFCIEPEAEAGVSVGKLVALVGFCTTVVISSGFYRKIVDFFLEEQK